MAIQLTEDSIYASCLLFSAEEYNSYALCWEIQNFSSNSCDLVCDIKHGMKVNQSRSYIISSQYQKAF